LNYKIDIIQIRIIIFPICIEGGPINNKNICYAVLAKKKIYKISVRKEWDCSLDKFDRMKKRKEKRWTGFSRSYLSQHILNNSKINSTKNQINLV
jgi:hypothetical protein